MFYDNYAVLASRLFAGKLVYRPTTSYEVGQSAVFFLTQVPARSIMMLFLLYLHSSGQAINVCKSAFVTLQWYTKITRFYSRLQDVRCLLKWSQTLIRNTVNCNSISNMKCRASINNLFFLPLRIHTYLGFTCKIICLNTM